MIIFIAADCTAGFLWRLRLWSNRWLHAHGKGYLLQILFHAADNIPCHVHVNIQTDNQKIENRIRISSTL